MTLYFHLLFFAFEPFNSLFFSFVQLVRHSISLKKIPVEDIHLTQIWKLDILYSYLK